MEKLQAIIEKVRLDLYEITKEKSLTDQDIIRMSQYLDRLLNEYQRIAM